MTTAVKQKQCIKDLQQKQMDQAFLLKTLNDIHLAELSNWECSAGPEDNSHLPAGKHCPGVSFSAASCILA